MGTRKRRSDRAGRGILRSPGRPGVARREDRRQFWAAIAAGLTSEDAARRAGVSPAVGTRWFREAGGMPPAALAPSSTPLAGRYLWFAEREEIALWRAQGHGVREVARRLGRAASTVSRELRRNAATRGGGLEYRATTAQWHAERAARRPKPAKLATNPALRAYVRDRLAGAVVAPGGGGRPGGAGALGGGPHPRPAQLGDRHAGGAHDAVHDVAPPAPHAGPRGGSPRQERPGARRARGGSGARRHRPHGRHPAGG